MREVRVHRGVVLTSALLVGLGLGGRATAQYVEVGPLDTLGQHLTQQLGGAETGSFDLALFSDCHLDRSYLPRNQDVFATALRGARLAGAKLVLALGDYGPLQSGGAPHLEHHEFNAILDQELGPAGSRNPAVALAIGNHDWNPEHGVGKALTLQSPNSDVSLQFGNSRRDNRYLYYSFVVGDPSNGNAVAVVFLDATTYGNNWILAETIQPEQLHWLHLELQRFRDLGLRVIVGMHEPHMTTQFRAGQLFPSVKNGRDVLKTILQFDNVVHSVHGHMRFTERYLVGGNPYRPDLQVNIVNMTNVGLRVSAAAIDAVQIGAAGNVTNLGLPALDFGTTWDHPEGIVVYGHSTIGSAARDLPVFIDVGSPPISGNASFSINCRNAPRSGQGWLALHASADPQGVEWSAVLGQPTTFVPIDGNTAFVPVDVDANGVATVPAPLSNVAAGSTVYCQFLVLEPDGSALLASNALRIVVQ